MISQIIDVTDQYNATQSVTLDVSLWDKVSVQIVGTFADDGITAYISNDSRAIQGVSDGGPSMATNFFGIQMTKLVDQTLISNMNVTGVYGTNIWAKYFRLLGGLFDDPASSKVIVFLSKPY